MSTSENKNCKTCNKVFVKLCGNHHYCSRSCRPKIRKICQTCKKEFMLTKNVNYDSYKFCSRKCFTSANFADNSPDWKGEDASSSAKFHWFKNNYGKAYECHSLCCTSKSKNYCYVQIEYDVLKDRIKNFAQLCRSCLNSRIKKEEDPNWDWHKIEKWHERIGKIIKVKKQEEWEGCCD